MFERFGIICFYFSAINLVYFSKFLIKNSKSTLFVISDELNL